MKSIFLDFDGVLNGRDWLVEKQKLEIPPAEHYFNNPCDPTLVANLQWIVDSTDARIVFSTSWRILSTEGQLIRYLMKAGFRPQRRHMFLGVTPRFHRPPNGEPRVRGHEIQAWLDLEGASFNPESFVILDDDSDMANLLPRLVQTRTALGLQPADARKAIEMLGVK